MATLRSNSRAMTQARDDVLTQLIEDHKRVKKAYKDFQKLDPESDPEAVQALVNGVLTELTIHAAVEEEILYPAARDVVEEDLVDEAEVEHESMHQLIDQLESLTPSDDKFAARFTVLCEYVLHHVKEEEGDMFPQLRERRLDWPSIAEKMARRRAEVSAGGSADDGSPAANDSDADDPEAPQPADVTKVPRGAERKTRVGASAVQRRDSSNGSGKSSNAG